jgi:DNA-binding NtrC family response regulator
LIFSTSRDLDAEAREGRFRRDLLHRIETVCLRVPPVRERTEDLRELVRIFLEDGRGQPPAVEGKALERLREHPWPGNVRELRNVLARLRLECAAQIGPEAVERHLQPGTGTLFPAGLLEREKLPALKARLERDYMVHHLLRLRGDARALSRFLGVSREQLYRRLSRLGIRLRAERKKRGLPERRAKR